MVMPLAWPPPKFFLVMKLVTVLLIITLAHASAKTFSQVTIDVKKAPLEKVLKVITKQTGYVFLYDSDLLLDNFRVTINANNTSFNIVLDQCFKDLPFAYKVVGKNIVIQRFQQKQQISPDPGSQVDSTFFIVGNVLGTNGQPLVGATVKVKEKRISTSTDKNGKFRVTVEAGQTLVFSYVGYHSKEWKVTKKEEISVTLDTQSNELNDVTVTTAYGIEKDKKELGYSVAKISGEELNRTNSGNLLTGLTGKVSGLNISNLGTGMNAENSVILRGLRSINASANNQPLFILNGSPLSFGSDQLAAGAVLDLLNSFNPNDIKDVTVLKGANGTALYGPEGVNGVIIINTKKGSGKTFGINFQTGTSWQQINFGRKKVQKTYGIGSILDDNGKPVYDPLGTDLWGPAYDGKQVQLGRPDENGKLQMVPYTYNDSRFKFWNKGRLTQNNLSLSQQDEKSDFYLGVNYIDQTGVLPGDKQTRVNMLLNTGRTVNRITKLRLNVLYDRANPNTGPSGIRTDNTPAFVKLTDYKDYINNEWADHNHYFDEFGYSPYELVAVDRTKTMNNVLSTSMELKITPLNWLTITERPALNYYSSISKETVEAFNFSDFAKESGRFASTVDLPANMNSSSLAQIALNNDFLISTTHHMGDFGLRTTIGNSIRETTWKQTQVIVPELVIPVFNPIYARDNNRSVLERDLLSRSTSVFGTFLFDYKQKVYLELIGRKDWDSKLAKEARSHNFYAGMNTSFILSDIIPALQGKEWLNMWKVTAAVNTTANMNILPQQSARTLESEPTYGDVPYFSYIRGNPNPKIQPEKILSQEYGTELTMFKNKLDLEVSYYRQRNSGLILDITTSQFSGAPTIDNAGVYTNQGMDLTLKINDLLKSRNGFFLDLSLLYATNNNKVISLPSSLGDQLLTYIGNTKLVAQTGKYAYSFALTDFKRTPDGKVIVDPTSGLPLIDFDNTVYKGRVLPVRTAGISINMGWNKFTFGATAEYRGGDYQYNESGAIDMRAGLLQATTYNNRQPFVVPNSVYMDVSGKYVPNTSIKVSSARDYFQQASSANALFLTRADYLRLNEVYVGYSLPLKSKVIKRIGARLYARDILNIYTKDNINGDPLSVRGPGTKTNDLSINQFAAASSNSAGSVATQSRLPGTSTFGFLVNASF